MAPNPIMISRKQDRQQHDVQHAKEQPPDLRRFSLPLIATSVAVGLIATLPWARRWLYSGSAVMSLLMLYGSVAGVRIIPSVPLWTLLASLNLIYAIASTSWLLYGLYTSSCWVLVVSTCLWQFEFVAKLVRKRLRKLLRHLHFTRDMIALFNLPALEIDTDVDGLFVVRGVTITLSTLTIVAHGVELGLKVTDDMELALYVDEVVIQLFRRVQVGDVYGSLKGGKSEMTFSDYGERPEDDEESIFQIDTPLLRAATAGSNGMAPQRPSVTRDMTGGVQLKDSSPKSGLDQVQTLSPDDKEAYEQYTDLLKQIHDTSHVNSALKQAQAASGDAGPSLEDEKKMRAAICAKLQDMPSVPHPPSRSVRVTSLQKMSPPYMRRFMHRLPFLLRLLLAPISYFHPIAITSISVAGSGKWLTVLLQQNVFKQYAAHDAEIRRLERKVGGWLANANFCLELTNIDGLGQVPLSSIYDIIAYLRFADIMAYRTALESGTIQQVVRLGGADATFTIPTFLLPHHEHLLPPEPTKEHEEEKAEKVAEADGAPKTVQAERELNKLKKDETEVTMSVHASLPACFDQSLLNFVAALVKATKVIELEKEFDEISEPEPPSVSRASTISSSTGDESPTSPGTAKLRKFARGIRQNIQDNMTSENIKEMARDLQQSTKDGMKKAVVGGVINDRWIAKMVGKVAAKLEQAQGDVGYSGGLPVALKPYRGSPSLPSKILP